MNLPTTDVGYESARIPIAYYEWPNKPVAVINTAITKPNFVSKYPSKNDVKIFGIDTIEFNVETVKAL